MATRQLTSTGHEYARTALGYATYSPMARSAMAVCELRGVDAFDNVWFEGHYLPRWRAAIIEGMMLYAIAEESAITTGARRGET